MLNWLWSDRLHSALYNPVRIANSLVPILYLSQGHLVIEQLQSLMDPVAWISHSSNEPCWLWVLLPEINAVNCIFLNRRYSQHAKPDAIMTPLISRNSHTTGESDKAIISAWVLCPLVHTSVSVRINWAHGYGVEKSELLITMRLSEKGNAFSFNAFHGRRVFADSRTDTPKVHGRIPLSRCCFES